MRTSLFLIAAISFASMALAEDKFLYKKSDMPFNATAVKRPIDEDCRAEGTGKGGAQEQQNAAKNRFDATGDPVTIKVTDFDRLERAAIVARNCAAKHKHGCHAVAIDQGGLPTDRSQLKDIATTAAGDSVGEGKLVTIVAKVLHAGYSNSKYNIYPGNQRGAGESVNCKGVPSKKASSEIDRNDIHIVLVAPGVKDECLSVTAEISPHYRPDAWRRFHNMKPNKAGDVNAEAKGVDFSQLRAVRITGPLFYDASHEACNAKGPNTPRRRSIWEIHPVYKLEVQKPSGEWLSFEEWAQTQ
jgi:hypothetical protein